MEKESKIYSAISTNRPLNISDRKSDLASMLAVKGNFVLDSLQKNGTTTLMNNFAALRDGVLIDCMDFLSENPISNLEKEIEQSGKLIVLLDEIASLYNFFRDDARCFDYLMQLSQRKQLILRFHTETRATTERMIKLAEKGFEIVGIGKIPYNEFKDIFDREFAGTGLNVPDKFIQYAHSQFCQLNRQVTYVAESFRLMVENPGKEFTEPQVEKITKFRVHDGTYRCKFSRY